MPQRKIPQDALLYYVALGPGRSYEKVAKEYGVSKRALVDHALRENWQDRIAELERRARENVDAKADDTAEEMYNRHLKLIRLMQGKAVETLRNQSLTKASEAVKTLEITMKQERLLHGEPSERTAVSIEDTIKREYERWMVVEEPDPPNDEDGEEDDVARGGGR